MDESGDSTTSSDQYDTLYYLEVMCFYKDYGECPLIPPPRIVDMQKSRSQRPNPWSIAYREALIAIETGTESPTRTNSRFGKHVRKYK